MEPETAHTWGRFVTLWGLRLSIHGAGVLHYRVRDCPYMGQACYTIRPQTIHTAGRYFTLWGPTLPIHGAGVLH